MAKTFVFDRFEIYADSNEHSDIIAEATAEGAWVKAQDAIDRDESLKAQIRVLEVQLKETRRVANSFRSAGVWEPDGSKFKTYRVDNLDGKEMYIKE